MKKTLSILLAFILIFSAVPMSGIADFVKNIDFSFLSVKSSAASVSDLTFTLNDDGNSYSVTDCNQSASGELIIPATYNSKPVTSIGDYAFGICKSLTSITIPNSVTSIGSGAFYNCSSLTNINVNNGNTEYTSVNGVLFNFNKTTLICYPAEKTDVNYYIPESVTDIYGMAFYNCVKLISITIPDSVTSIGDSAFCYCRNLISVTIGDGVTSIGNHAFYYCRSITSITLPDSVTNIGEKAFGNCSSLTNITIPDGVMSIGNNAFCDCSSLTNITIPDGVKSMGYSAFCGTAYYNDSSNWENGVLYIGNHLIKADEDIISGAYTIKNGTKTIAGLAFYYCSSLNSITIPDSITNIGEKAFGNCSRLTNITIPNSVTDIGNYAFENCSNLTNVTIGNSVTSIGGWAFNECGSLTSITIPDSVTNIGNYAFYNCSSLTSITIPDGVTTIDNYAFYGCSSFTTITIPEGVTSIGDEAFRGCSGLTKVKIPVSVTSIGNYAFCNCSSLTTITIPDSVNSIGRNAFCNCSSLTSITIPDGVTSIGWTTFGGCSSLTSITIPDSVTSIGFWAFDGCSSLTSITIPDGVMSIGRYAFRGCSSLKIITIPDGVTSINYETFSGCSSLTSITIPNSVTRIYNDAFSGCKNLTIKCYKNSTAHKFAVNNNIKYTLIDDWSNKNSTVKLGSASIQNGSVKVTWSKLSGAESYIVYRKANSEKTWSKIGTSKTTSYTDKSVKSGTTYKYTVCGVNGTTNSKKNETGISVLYLSAPGTKAVNKNGYISVSWGKVTGATGYIVYRKAGSAKTWSKLTTISKNSTVTYTDKSVKSGTDYTYCVKAYNGKTTSAGVNTTALKYLSQPKLSKVTSAKSGITVQWGKVTGASGYIVYRKTGSGKFTKLATVKGNTKVSYLDKSAKKGTTYTYTVKAYNGKTYSAYNTTGLKIKDKF